MMMILALLEISWLNQVTTLLMSFDGLNIEKIPPLRSATYFTAVRVYELSVTLHLDNAKKMYFCDLKNRLP
jgi:tRNA U55 pseudouridine synthase TruB